MKKRYRLPVAAFLAVAGIAAVWLLAGIYFETNDDRLIGEIYSGAMTGSPNGHSFYVNDLLGIPVSFLYRIAGNVAWYGYLLVFLQGLSWFAIANALLSSEGGLPAKAGYFCVLFACGFYFIANIQFTTTAALLALAGYLCLFLHREEKKGLVCFFVLELLALLLRDKAMLLMQPFGMAVFGSETLVKLVQHKNAEKGEEHSPVSSASIRFFALAGGLLALALFLGYGTKFLSYGTSEEWKEYQKINDAVTVITDYTGIPEYESVREILDRYGVSEKQYAAFFQYVMLDENLSGDCLLEIAEVASANRVDPSVADILSQTFGSYLDGQFFRINLVVLAAWILTILVVFFGAARELLLPMAGIFAARSVDWFFLLYQGRTPARVLMPLHFAELALLLYLCLRVYLCAGKVGRMGQRVFLAAALGLVALSSAVTLFEQYRHTDEVNKGQKILIESLVEVQEYCDRHPENRYVLEMGTTIYQRGSAFENRLYHPVNYLITGCWYSGAPGLIEHIADYLDSAGEVYLITSPELTIQAETVKAYFAEKYGEEARLFDSFTTSVGAEYEVYAFPAR